MSENPVKLKSRAREIYTQLSALYPNAHCSLKHRNPMELLIATILSAQCTDERVNKVTPELFHKYPRVTDFANADLEDLSEAIRSTGFYRNKAKNIQGACQKIVSEYQGIVPQTMEELLTLPGVARKTANVVLGNAFGKSAGIVVDTHVGRLAFRMGLTEETSPEKIEQDLIKLFEREQWIQLSHLLIYHGRAVCKARNPDCKACTLRPLCPQKIQ